MFHLFSSRLNLELDVFLNFCLAKTFFIKKPMSSTAVCNSSWRCFNGVVSARYPNEASYRAIFEIIMEKPSIEILRIVLESQFEPEAVHPDICNARHGKEFGAEHPKLGASLIVNFQSRKDFVFVGAVR